MSSFKNKYDNDPVFKANHLKYIKEKINCSHCGKITSRSNLSSHRKSKLCLKISSSKIDADSKINEITQRYIEALSLLSKKQISEINK